MEVSGGVSGARYQLPILIASATNNPVQNSLSTHAT